MTTSLIRDFLYLDVEALRSLTAQLLGGVPETLERTREHEAGGTATAEAGLLSFLRASGEAEYTYRRSGTETQSLHHQVYTRFEESLSEKGALEEINDSFDYESEWIVDRFSDGAFVKARGRIQLADYSRTLAAIEGFPKLLKAFNAMQMLNIKNSVDAGQLLPEEATAQRRQLQETENATKKIPVEGILALGRNLYSEGEVRVKVQTSGAPDGHVLVGTGRVGNLLAPLGTEGLVQTPDAAEWVAVGQVATGVPTAELKPIHTGNALEDSVQQVGSALRELVKTGNAAIFPAFEFKPLAIYREVQLG